MLSTWERIENTFLRLFRQEVHAFNVSDIRDVRFFASTLSFTTGSGSVSQAGVEEDSAIDCRVSDGGDVGLEDEGDRAGWKTLFILHQGRERLVRKDDILYFAISGTKRGRSGDMG